MSASRHTWLAARPVPMAYYHGQQQPDRPLVHNRGWTPPYWYSPWWADCLMP